MSIVYGRVRYSNLRLFHSYQHCTHYQPPIIFSLGFIVTLAGDQREYVVLLMWQGAQVVGAALLDGTHFIDVAKPPGMDDDLVAVLKRVQIHKGAGLVVRIPDMGGDGGVARPGGECCAFEIASLIPQPTHIPAIAGEGNAGDGQFHA